MIIYNLKSVFRSYSRSRFFTLSNILSLTIGLSIALIVFLWILYQFSFNTFPANADNIYRIVQNENNTKGTKSAILPLDLAERLKDNFPEIEEIAKIIPTKNQILKTRREGLVQANACGVNPGFFNLFTFTFISGIQKNCLQAENSVVITESLAKKIFPDKSPMGKMIDIKSQANKPPSEYIITAIIKDPPSNSEMRYTKLFLNSQKIDEEYRNRMRKIIDWGQKIIPMYCTEFFISLKKNIDRKEFENKLTKFIQNNTFPLPNEKTTYTLQSLSDIHLYSSDIQSFLKGQFAEDIKYIYIFAGIAILFLLGSFLNFFGYILIIFSKKMKEVGINKFLGAGNFNLFKKISIHSIVTISISLLFSIILSIILYKNINHLSPVFPPNHDIFIFHKLAIFILLVLLSSLFPGIHITAVISKVKATEILQNRIVNIDIRKYLWRIFITGQIAITSFLIACSIIIFHQISFLKNYDTGYDKQNVISFSTYNYETNNPDKAPDEAKRFAKIMKTELSSFNTVEYVTRASNLPINEQLSQWKILNIDGNQIPINTCDVDNEFFKTWGIKFVKSTALENLKADFNYAILPERTAKRFGIDYKNNPLPIQWNDYIIVGIIKNIHIGSFKEKKLDIIFHYCIDGRINGYSLAVKFKNGKEKQTVEFINSQWKKLTGTNSPAFLNSSQSQFQFYEEVIILKALSLFAIITLFMALISIFSTVSFNIKNKTKEIGIRKIMGASAKIIFFLIVKEIIVVVFIAGIIISPFVFIVMNKWLQDFSYRIDISWWIFALTSGIALLIALATVSFQAIKAAFANPVESLRYE